MQGNLFFGSFKLGLKCLPLSARGTHVEEPISQLISSTGPKTHSQWPLSLSRRSVFGVTLQWRHNGCDGVSDHQPHDCLLNRLLRRRSKKTPTLRVTDLCAWNSPVTGEFPSQMARNAENDSIWWRYQEVTCLFKIRDQDSFSSQVNFREIACSESV